MNLLYTVNQEQLLDLLLTIGSKRTVFIWGAPGIGKSAIVEELANELGMECVSLLGSQLAPEDIIGIPQIRGETSVFLPPKMIVKEKPFVLFLDELNACTQEVQKAFYSLIHERRIGEYRLPEGSIVIGAGNRMEDSAIVKNMSSALINRMIHVELKTDPKKWIEWAYDNNIHPYIIDYIKQRPDHLYSKASKTQDVFSSPRAWHMLSDVMNEMGAPLDEVLLKVVTYGCISSTHAAMFLAYIKQVNDKGLLNRIIKGEQGWPSSLEERDILFFLVQSFKAKLCLELPVNKDDLDGKNQYFVHRAKLLIKQLAQINAEMAQMIIEKDENQQLPSWFLIDIIRDIPRLIGNEK